MSAQEEGDLSLSQPTFRFACTQISLCLILPDGFIARVVVGRPYSQGLLHQFISRRKNMKTKYNTAPSWRRRLFLAFPPLAAIVCALMLVMPALAATDLNIDIPISGIAGNPCNGEILTFSGVAHSTMHITFDNSGGYHDDFHANIHITATGDQGNTYVGNEEVNNPFNGKVGFETTFTLTLSAISQGSAPNFVMQMVQHITVHPDGTVTAFVNKLSATCRG
jgi:hypothetical protein